MRFEDLKLGVSLDISRMCLRSINLSDWDRPLSDMIDLEQGKIANPDEHRQVGHYWLRDQKIAPPEERIKIEESWSLLRGLVQKIQQQGFRQLLMVGIGGSALGPQFLVDALGGEAEFEVFFIDNTDPDGMDRVFSKLDPEK